MKVPEFESYLKKGLGRAVLLLRGEPDKTPFRDGAAVSGVFKQLCSCADCRLLHVKGIQLRRLHLRQGQSVVAVSAGGVNYRIARIYVSADDVHSKFCSLSNDILHG